MKRLWSSLDQVKNNFPPLTWYCEETSLADGSFYYSAHETQEQGYTEKHYKGQVGEITPGVAYIEESGFTVYNSRFPALTASEGRKTTTWEEFGITQELYNKYLSAVLNREFPLAFNIKVGDNYSYTAGYQKAEQNHTNYLYFECGWHDFQIYDDGVVKIVPMIY